MSETKPLTVTLSLIIQEKLRAEARKRGMKLKCLVEQLLKDGLAKKAA